LELRHEIGIRKNRIVGALGGMKSDMFSRFDTMKKCDRQPDTHTDRETGRQSVDRQNNHSTCIPLLCACGTEQKLSHTGRARTECNKHSAEKITSAARMVAY